MTTMIEVRKHSVVAAAASAALALALIFRFVTSKSRKCICKCDSKVVGTKPVVDGVLGAIGNTPLIRINSLSEATGCEILAKAEFLNPGGSVKDRVAVKIIQEALESGHLVRGGIVTEGSAGSTAISLAMVAPAYGCKCHVVIPDDAAIEKVTRGVLYTPEEAEGKRLKNPFDTITEGIGINRLTQNFMMARLDGAFRGTDMEAVEMSRFLMKNDGLFVGSSSAMNCVGAVHVARLLGPGHKIVTILCDSGMRHLSKFYNPQYLSAHGLTPCALGLEFLGNT